MKLKIASALLVAALLTQSLVSCGGNNDGVDTTSDSSTSSPETKRAVTAAEIGKAIEDEFGKEYSADTEIDAEILDAIYGVKPEWVKESYAKQAAIGYSGDLFIAIRAEDKHADDVEDALLDYADYNLNSAVQYVGNLPKISAARVYRVGDYVFYIILGVMDYSLDADTNYKTAESFDNRAIGVIDSLLK